jgi:Ca-activated chloride channel family protein
VTHRDGRLAVRSDRRLVRAVHHSTRYLMIEITAPSASAAPVRPRVNVAFVLDRSGSMAGPKIVLARDAVREGIERLAADDRFAVVVYDDQIDVLTPGRIASSEAKRDAIRALREVDSRGTTNLAAGWLRGAEQVAMAIDREAVNRTLLLTDGLANQGITDRGELVRHASELRARGVHTSTFGVGEDFDERLLGGMADAGGGVFRFIGRADQIPELIRNEVGELLEVTARDVVLRLAGPELSRIEPLSSFAFDRTAHETVVHIGDLVSNQLVRVVVALEFPLGQIGQNIAAQVALGDVGGQIEGSETLTWTFADGQANDRQPRDRDVDRLVARTYADRALRDAVDVNRRGEWAAAREMLLSVARRIRTYAGEDPVLLGIVAELEREADAWARERSEFDRKARFMESVSFLRTRNVVTGAAERRA